VYNPLYSAAKIMIKYWHIYMIHSRKIKCSSHRTEIKAFTAEITIKKNRQTFFIYPWREIHGIGHRKNKTAQQKKSPEK